MRFHPQVINAYKNASAALKAVFAETGLSEDNVANTMDDLEDVSHFIAVICKFFRLSFH
jgi:hypothetical protein